MSDPLPNNPPNAAAEESTIPDDGVQPATPGLVRRLHEAEELWAWKMGLRVVTTVLAVIGIGCMGWAFSTRPMLQDVDFYGWGDSYFVVWTLITFGASAIWCSICILVLLLRRPNKPVHPGVAVGIDLVLWLAYIPTAMFALLGLLSLLDWGAYGRLSTYYGTSRGDYEQAANGTWVWITDDSGSSSYYGQGRDCDGQYSQFSQFHSCVEQDAYINTLWNAKGHRAAVEKVGVACQFLNLALHLALFIWACVDTHRKNSRRVSKDAEKLASDIVMNMIRTGAVVPNNQGTMQQPLLQHPQQPPQGGLGPVPRTPPPVVLGQEKGESSRFA